MGLLKKTIWGNTGISQNMNSGHVSSLSAMFLVQEHVTYWVYVWTWVQNVKGHFKI